MLLSNLAFNFPLKILFWNLEGPLPNPNLNLKYQNQSITSQKVIVYSKGGIHNFISLAEISELAAPHNSCKVCNKRDHAVLQATDLW